MSTAQRELLKHKFAKLKRERNRLNRFLRDYGFNVYTGKFKSVLQTSGTGEKLETRWDANIRNIRCRKLSIGNCPNEYYPYLNAAVKYPDKFRKLVAYTKLLKKLCKKQRELD